MKRIGLLVLIAAIVAIADQRPASSSSTGPKEHRRTNPGAAGLDPALSRALRRAAADAADAGVQLSVESGRYADPTHDPRMQLR